MSAIELCADCGFGRAAPCPQQAELDRFYASGAYWHGSTNPYQLAHERVQAGIRVQRCSAFMPGKRALRVLDVGAGHGFIASSLEAIGRVATYDFHEPDEPAACQISATAGTFPRRRIQSLDEAEHYDVLFLNHVLEHVANPEVFLRVLLNRLVPDALAYVETPFADYRFKSDVFPHVLFFTPGAFVALGKRLSVQTLAVEAFGRMPRYAFSRKLADISFRCAVRYRLAALQKAIDRAIWSYAVQPDGVWLRWIFRKGSPSG